MARLNEKEASSSEDDDSSQLRKCYDSKTARYALTLLNVIQYLFIIANGVFIYYYV